MWATSVDFSDCLSCHNGNDNYLFGNGPRHHHPWWKMIIPKREKSILSVRLIAREAFITSNHLPFFRSLIHSRGHQSSEISISSITNISLQRPIICFKKQLVVLLFQYRGIQWNRPSWYSFGLFTPALIVCVIYF